MSYTGIRLPVKEVACARWDSNPHSEEADFKSAASAKFRHKRLKRKYENYTTLTLTLAKRVRKKIRKPEGSPITTRMPQKVTLMRLMLNPGAIPACTGNTSSHRFEIEPTPHVREIRFLTR